MNVEEILDKLDFYSDKIGGWKIALGGDVKKPFYIGYYYNKDTGKYRYYSTLSNMPIQMWTDKNTEEEALKLVYEKVISEYDAHTNTQEKIDELIKKYKKLEIPISIHLDYHSQADSCKGYFYDPTDELWKVFENGERGFNSIRFCSAKKEDALAEFYKQLKYNSTYTNYKDKAYEKTSYEALKNNELIELMRGTGKYEYEGEEERSPFTRQHLVMNNLHKFNKLEEELNVKEQFVNALNYLIESNTDDLYYSSLYFIFQLDKEHYNERTIFKPTFTLSEDYVNDYLNKLKNKLVIYENELKNEDTVFHLNKWEAINLRNNTFKEINGIDLGLIK
jgi:hypothetical protein